MTLPFVYPRKLIAKEFSVNLHHKTVILKFHLDCYYFRRKVDRYELKICNYPVNASLKENY